MGLIKEPEAPFLVPTNKNPAPITQTLSPLQLTVQQARQHGETLKGFPILFPVLEDAQQKRYYEPLPFKQIKKLKQACAQYGPTAPFTVSIIEALNSQYLPPNDWTQVSRACLTGGDYLLWNSKSGKQCGILAKTKTKKNGLQISFKMLMRKGVYRVTNQQLNYPPEAYPQINKAALIAKKLPTSNKKSKDFSKIRQGPDKPYQDFVARLLKSVSQVIRDEKAGMVITPQLAYKNANSACQAALRPYQKKGGIADYIRICADIGPSYMQGLTIAAALQGKTVKEILYQQAAKGRIKNRINGPPGSCFSCGKMGHRAIQCPQQQKGILDKQNEGPKICLRRKKGRHWARDCRSKTDINGKTLEPMSGNWVRGQPQAPKQCYGALQKNHPEMMANLELETSTELPQAAQDWTSVPPPIQY
ncbi:endogenous retrovirus group K member 10 Gag polyprotein-like [Moschus berezovskii]|uniref:endogenous retrovirus group K member 10 Gag polyprotein-like n=1 Tax=Moschus berezovskii TaxID=68408 RepID=UPI002444D269|nr:endogenous retrovirus group K member 10 Gag polyprotein-like [Moschus berezovskii]